MELAIDFILHDFEMAGLFSILCVYPEFSLYVFFLARESFNFVP